MQNRRQSLKCDNETAILCAMGQPLLKHSLDKVKRSRKIIRDNNYACLLEVDGGVTIENAQSLCLADANILVLGTVIYDSTDVWGFVALLKSDG